TAERSDGRDITVRNVTLPLVYLVTVAGIIGLVRARRRRGAELLLLEGAYFTVVSVAVIAVPRLRAPLDLAAAIGVGLLVAEVVSRRAPEAREPAPAAARRWLLSPRLAGDMRTETRDAARTLDEALFELKVLDLVTSGNRNPGTAPAAALDASRATYETEARPANNRLPDWDIIRTN